MLKRRHWYAPPPDCVHIHGSKDELFPLNRMAPTHIIQRGNHYMVMDRAEEVARGVKGVKSVKNDMRVK